MKITKKPLLDNNGEAREITADELKHFKPASKVLPARLKAKLGIHNRPRSHAPRGNAYPHKPVRNNKIT